MTTREELVREARSWVGTRFRHQGRTRNGVDCIGLLVCSARAVGLELVDRTDYARRPDGRQLAAELRAQLVPIELAAALPGDVLLLSFDRSPGHVALVSDAGLIHAAALLRRVVEHRMDELWRGRVRGAFRFRELEQ